MPNKTCCPLSLTLAPTLQPLPPPPPPPALAPPFPLLSTCKTYAIVALKRNQITIESPTHVRVAIKKLCRQRRKLRWVRRARRRLYIIKKEVIYNNNIRKRKEVSHSMIRLCIISILSMFILIMHFMFFEISLTNLYSFLLCYNKFELEKHR